VIALEVLSFRPPAEQLAAARHSLKEAIVETVSAELQQYGHRRKVSGRAIFFAIQRARQAVVEGGHSGAEAYRAGARVIERAASQGGDNVVSMRRHHALRRSWR